MYDNKLIICVDDYLPKETCDRLIDFYESNKNYSEPCAQADALVFEYDSFKNRLIDDFSIPFSLDKMEIAKRTTGSYMNEHLDGDDKLAFSLCLNDDYEGGETFFESCTIKPKVGRLALFSNGKIRHGVNEVTRGTRYNLLGWFV